MMRGMFYVFFFLQCVACNAPKLEKTDNTNTLRIVPEGMVWVPGGQFRMGNVSSNTSQRDVVHDVYVDGFYMDVHEVTNGQFKSFTDATGYVTTAEKDIDWEELKDQLPTGSEKPHDSLLRAGSIVFTKPIGEISNLKDYHQWWSWVVGANWKQPTGSNSTIADKMNHPVVHISWFDAMAYAEWAGKDLPTEAEWELAARASSPSTMYPWGSRLPSVDEPKANYFQGNFPTTNTLEDGFRRTAAVKSFPPNKYGIYDLGGNVWEWCKDYYNVTYFKQCKDLGLIKNPQGPDLFYDPNDPYVEKRVLKGGSFLCNDVYCSGYRINNRMSSDVYSAQDHSGFRCVKRK